MLEFIVNMTPVSTKLIIMQLIFEHYLLKKAYLCSLNCYYYHYGHCHRFVDSFVGHHARRSLRLFHEEKHVAEVTEVAAGFCIWRDDSRLGVVVAHPCH